ncbi:hypothetical protein C5748_09775 [Phyllobacterium phragmitis]|uniref:Uncharacterized protein n=2 Tax=Phyllobacterium phragmitis TaxID=2670329 RepID=A0A2S9ISQ4_9HYPH|nr:hypothetical protein C5748_09775 [Phyllobacterium phragmitis]
MMTNIFNPYSRLGSVEAIRHKVLVRLDRCRTEFARAMHVRLLEMLDEMRVDIESELPIWIELDANRHKSESDAFLFELYFERPCCDQRWINEGPISVLEEISVLVHGDEPGIVCGVTLDHTLVPASELDGLDEIFAEIGVHFIAARVKHNAAA